MIQDLNTILPELLLLTLLLGVLMVDVFAKGMETLVTLAGLLVILVSLVFSMADGNVQYAFSEAFIRDNISQVSKIVLVLATITVIGISRTYFQGSKVITGEYLALILSSLLGMFCLVSSGDLMMFFLSLELMSLPVFSLIGIKINEIRRSEAAIKYLILGALSSAVFLMGTAFIYGAAANTKIPMIREMLMGTSSMTTFAYIGLSFLLVSVLFKLAIVPFHAWAPDAYHGAPTPVTAFMGTCVKFSALIASARILGGIDFAGLFPLKTVIIGFAVVTIIFGNILAIVQSNVKRILAYSSIANAGFLMLAFVYPSYWANMLIYAIFYIISNLLLFSVICSLRSATSRDDVMDISEFQGLGDTAPYLAAGLSLGLIAVSGIPPFPGFYGKYVVLMEVIRSGSYLIPTLVLLSTLASMYYYLRIVVAVFMKDRVESSAKISPNKTAPFTTLVLSFIVLGLSVFPGILLDTISTLVEKIS